MKFIISITASVKPPGYDGPLKACVKVEPMYRETYLVEKSKLVKGLCKGVNLGAYMFGFPNLRHIKFKVCIFEKFLFHFVSLFPTLLFLTVQTRVFLLYLLSFMYLLSTEKNGMKLLKTKNSNDL